MITWSVSGNSFSLSPAAVCAVWLVQEKSLCFFTTECLFHNSGYAAPGLCAGYTYRETSHYLRFWNGLIGVILFVSDINGIAVIGYFEDRSLSLNKCLAILKTLSDPLSREKERYVLSISTKTWCLPTSAHKSDESLNRRTMQLVGFVLQHPTLISRHRLESLEYSRVRSINMTLEISNVNIWFPIIDHLYGKLPTTNLQISRIGKWLWSISLDWSILSPDSW